MRAKLMGLVLFCLVAGAAWPLGAKAQVSHERPWNLAVVLESAPLWHQPWQGTTRLAALEAALLVELRSLPLRASAGVWLAAGGRPDPLVEPRPALGLKRLELLLPRQKAGGSLAGGIAAAAAWLEQNGPGTILVIAADGARTLSRAQLEGLPLERAGLFCQVLGLPGRVEDARRLQALALAGGGAYFQAPAPSRLAGALRGAMAAALTPGRLELRAADANNRPLDLIFGLSRRDEAAFIRKGLVKRVLQLPPGLYRLDLPAGSGVGPAAPPATVSAVDSGSGRVWVGGQAELEVACRDGQGKDLNWQIVVAGLAGGKIWVPTRRAPFTVTLPAGQYMIKSLNPAHNWQVELAAGARPRLVIGPPGRCTLALPGPSGPLRLPYRVWDLKGNNQVTIGYTGDPLRLLPGSYRLEVEVIPPLSARLDLAPAQQKKLELEPVGALLVKGQPGQQKGRFWVLDSRGRTLGGGRAGRTLFLRPGAYQVQFQVPPARAPVRIKGGQTTRVTPPGP